MADSVLLAELLPELASNYTALVRARSKKPALISLPSVGEQGVLVAAGIRGGADSLLLPHCPA